MKGFRKDLQASRRSSVTCFIGRGGVFGERDTFRRLTSEQAMGTTTFPRKYMESAEES